MLEADGYSPDPKEGTASVRSNFEFLPPLEFLDDFVANAAQAQRRVLLQSMYFEADHVTGAFFNGLVKAANRGVHTELHIDHFSNMVSEGGINYIPSLHPVDQQYRRFLQHRKVLSTQALEAANVRVVMVNPPSILERVMPSRGRNHIKMGIVDDVAWVGGLNLSDKDFRRADVMIRIDDPNIVEALATQFSSVNESRPSQDYEVTCTPDTSLLVDRGTPGKSLILDRAVALTAQAQRSVKLVTQFTPDGKILHALHASHARGVSTTTIVSEPAMITEAIARWFDKKNQVLMQLSGVKLPLLEYPNWIHVKMLLVDQEIPERARLFIGTHNFLESGVNMGTEEVALQSSDTVFLSRASSYYQNLLPVTKVRRPSGSKQEKNNELR